MGVCCAQPHEKFESPLPPEQFKEEIDYEKFAVKI